MMSILGRSTYFEMQSATEDGVVSNPAKENNTAFLLTNNGRIMQFNYLRPSRQPP
jgi:hypothetical protein